MALAADAPDALGAGNAALQLNIQLRLGIGAIIRIIMGPHACSEPRSECIPGPRSVAICIASVIVGLASVSSLPV